MMPNEMQEHCTMTRKSDARKAPRRQQPQRGNEPDIRQHPQPQTDRDESPPKSGRGPDPGKRTHVGSEIESEPDEQRVSEESGQGLVDPRRIPPDLDP